LVSPSPLATSTSISSPSLAPDFVSCIAPPLPFFMNLMVEEGTFLSSDNLTTSQPSTERILTPF